MNLVQAASLFVKMGVAYKAGVHRALEEACIIVEKEAKDVIGTYKYGWPQLSPATQEDREKKGFTANDPGLRTGEMKDSIDHTVRGHSGHVGSDDQNLVWFELGTKTQPPRSVLMQAAMTKEKEVVNKLGQELIVRRLLRGP